MTVMLHWGNEMDEWFACPLCGDGIERRVLLWLRRPSDVQLLFCSVFGILVFVIRSLLIQLKSCFVYCDVDKVSHTSGLLHLVFAVLKVGIRHLVCTSIW